MIMKWYYSQWRFKRNDNWWIDLYLLDQIISRVPSRPVLWRFHRRSVNDEAQHQFTFYFYADEADGPMIQGQIRKLALMKDLGLGKDIVLFQQATMGEGIAITSDPHWPDYLQEAWVCFITGACDTFVKILKEKGMHVLEGDPDALIEKRFEKFYRQVDDEMGLVWQDYGHPAFIHHLSALFHGGWCRIKNPAEFLLSC